jgi:phage gp45-like
MKGETRDKIESPQNYGFSSVCMDGDDNGSAEGFMSYPGGNRSFAYCGVMDDRRHRLKGLDKGDVAMFRTKDDNQQFHMTGDGGFWSAPTDKTVRMQLVKKQDQQQQGGTQAGQQDASGGSSSSSGQGQQGGQSKNGQKAVRKNSSHQYVDVTENATNVSGTNTYMRLQDGKGYLHCSSDAKVWVGAEKGKAKFARLLTEDGPSVNSYGNLGSSRAVGRLPDGRTIIITDPPPIGTTPPGTPDFPDPVPPARCFYTEATEFDAHVGDFNTHVAADAWTDFAGNPGNASTLPVWGTKPGEPPQPPLYQPFKFMRSEASGQAPSSIGKGSFGLNAADGILFWLNAAGGLAQANLASIASIPGLQALTQITALTLDQTVGTTNLTLDPRTNKIIAFLWGGAGGATAIAGTPGGNGGTTSFGTLAHAYGGTGQNLSGDGATITNGQPGAGDGGVVITGGGPAGASIPTQPGAKGGDGSLVIAVTAVTPGGTYALTIGAGGAGQGAASGGAGGALIIQLT